MTSGSDARQRIGLIGIGLLGTALAERLLQGGFDVLGYDLSTSARSHLKAIGGQVAENPRDVGSHCRQLVLCLPNSDVVENILEELQPVLTPASVIIDTTTGDPQRTRRSAEQLASLGVQLADATVLGSSVVTRAGEAVLMVGAADDVFAACEPMLGAISDRIHHVGPVGSGQEMKLVANLVLGLNRAVLAEGLHFADSMGLNLHSVLTVLQSGAAHSAVMEAKGRKMIEEDFVPQARLSQHLKDVRLILNRARAEGTGLPLSDLHQQLLEQVERAGGGDLDNSAIIRAWDRRGAAEE